MASWHVAVAVALTAGLGMAQTPDLSGTWKLNVPKSAWGKHPKPISGTIVIEHHEPSFQYSGTIRALNGPEGGEEKRTFEFNGAIDGKEYPVTGPQGQGTMSIHRVSPTTLISELKSDNGSLLETARTTVSRDGKEIIREIKAYGASGVSSWTEIYDRQ